MAVVRAKFAVTSITTSAYKNGEDQWVEQFTINMHPVYSSDPNSENKKFWDATPTGAMSLGTVNKAAADAFKPGREYYIDFTPAE